MKTIVFALAVFVLASAASANTPNASLSSVDHVIISSWNNVPAGNGLAPCSGSPAGFDVWVRDSAGNPVGSAQVKVTFAGTGTSIRPYKPQGPQGPITIHCIDHSMSGFTDGQGHLNFTPHFGRYAETNVVEVTADGVVLALIQARSPDYDCDGDVDLLDFSTFVGDYTDTHYHPRSDFDDCPATTLGDLSFFVNQYVASANSGVPIDVCP
jgi:hypothetical protein